MYMLSISHDVAGMCTTWPHVKVVVFNRQAELKAISVLM